MKQTFSNHWNSSTQPRKQRKYRFNAPLHVKSTFLGTNLSKDLRAKYGTRSLRVRTGDTVKIARGQFAGRSGKVDHVDTVRTRVYVNGIDQAKRDGTRRLYPLNPSNLMITSVADDKRRFPTKQGEKPAKVAPTPKATAPSKTAPAAKKQAKVTA